VTLTLRVPGRTFREVHVGAPCPDPARADDYFFLWDYVPHGVVVTAAGTESPPVPTRGGAASRASGGARGPQPLVWNWVRSDGQAGDSNQHPRGHPVGEP
jgi:hypothetical protein